MARKNQEVNGDCNGKPWSPKNHSAVYFNSITSTKKEEKVFSRLSPSRTPSSTGGSPGTSPRMSPGMLAGHYAGCKWSEPPLPSALPRPPQHWMPTMSTFKCGFLPSNTHQADAYQLKVLLNVQA